MTKRLKSFIAVVVAGISLHATAVDVHQIVVPQSDGIAIEPQHRAHVLADPNRDLQLNRENATWFVMEPPRARALMPEEEERLAAEEAQVVSDMDGNHRVQATLYFPFNQALPISWEPISAIEGDALKPISHIEVIGHADEVGTEDYNLRLSEKRASAVANYLATKGVGKSRLHAEGHGKREPVASGSDAQNRRVVVNVVFEDQVSAK